MKFIQLATGKQYRTKIGPQWQLVQLIDMREVHNVGKAERDKEVIVKSGAGNLIYRTAGQLKAP